MTKFSKVIALVFIALSLVGIAWLISSLFRKETDLPVLGEAGHKAGKFSFTNQYGKQVSQADVEEKITVVEYFFTTCTGICKIMNKNLATIHRRFKTDNNFVILSHTVDPETDSVAALARYAKLMNVQEPGWEFLTGDKTELYDGAKKDYLLSVDKGPGTNINDEFIHTEYVALLDKKRRIRGFYNATDSMDMVKMAGDISKLLKD
jgi:protein SCO1